MNHDNATASITVAGLALGCFNSATSQWEVGLIRSPRHTLVMEVYKETRDRMEQIHRKDDFDPNAWISILADKAITPDERFFRSNGDKEDFGLVLDIEKEVYETKIDFFKPPKETVTPLLVFEPKLYSVKDKLSRFPLKTVKPDGKDHKHYGRKGTAVGGDIECKSGGSVTLRVEGPGGFELPLPAEKGTRYIISFDNTCPPVRAGSEEEKIALEFDVRKVPNGPLIENHSDFVLYYSLIDEKGKGKFDLKEEKKTEGEGAICNKSFLGLTDKMFPLT